MPDVVAKGRAPKLWACGYCHLPTGQGRPENSSLAGLDADYMMQQVMDMKSGKRKVSQPKMEPVVRMHEAAEAVSLEDLKTATDYFASLTYKPWIKVVETDKVPKTKILAMYVPLGNGETEPLGERIIEVPENPDLTDKRDFQTGFIAYVPKGSIKRGEKLAKKGVNGSAPCGTCHGADYRGLGPVPTLTGRSPTYTGRQLWDMREGFRAGTWSPLMMQTVAGIKDKDIIDLAAYFASLKP
jgi:cytochrome c553